MIEISPALAVVIMIGLLVVFLALGLPIAFALGGVGALSIILFWGPVGLRIIADGAWAVVQFHSMLSIPLFVFMAMILEGAGVIDALFRSVRFWFGGINGGLAITVVFVSTIIGAMSGVSTTGIVTMGIVALPIMLKLNYSKQLAIGPIMAGGGLALLVPPSVGFIIYGAIAEVSIGRLFLGGLFPGLILAFMYISYIAIACYIKPELGPALPPEERVGFREKILSTKGFILPALLILAVLLPIFAGVASPTEAAAVGGVGAILCAAINHRLNWKMFLKASRGTFRITCLLLWIIIGAFIFKSMFIRLGGLEVIEGIMTGVTLAPLSIVFLMQVSYMIMGCFLNETTMLMVTLPVYIPILTSLGFNKLWFGVLFMINMQMAILTPPFGFGLFTMRAVAPPEVELGDIYRSVLPFIPMQVAVIVLVMFVPQLAEWLPDVVFGSF